MVSACAFWTLIYFSGQCTLVLGCQRGGVHTPSVTLIPRLLPLVDPDSYSVSTRISSWAFPSSLLPPPLDIQCRFQNKAPFYNCTACPTATVTVQRDSLHCSQQAIGSSRRQISLTHFNEHPTKALHPTLISSPKHS